MLFPQPPLTLYNFPLHILHKRERKNASKWWNVCVNIAKLVLARKLTKFRT